MTPAARLAARTGRAARRATQSRHIAPALLLALTGACATHTGTDAVQSGSVCRYDTLTFDARFAGGRLDGCRRTGRNHYVLAIRPEDEPINPSPWYAFDIAATSARTLSLTLDYGDARHRYQPKRLGPHGWEPVPGEVDLDRDGSRATVRLTIPGGRTRLAAQPIIAPRDAQAWALALAESSGLRLTTLGRSAQGRDLIVLASRAEQPETLVITGRQHPPEITGALALRSFVERLTADDELARRFRSRFGLLVVPMLNPDGVARGHWRHDTAGTDLNRDWGPFRRPETRALRDALQGLAETGSPPALLVDFHSTWHDVLYTQPDEAPGARAGLPAAWNRAINARLEGADLIRSDSHNPGRPTLKTWVHETFDVPGITFEVGDDTPQARIQALGRIAADTLMTLLLTQGTVATGGRCPDNPA